MALIVIILLLLIIMPALLLWLGHLVAVYTKKAPRFIGFPFKDDEISAMKKADFATRKAGPL